VPPDSTRQPAQQTAIGNEGFALVPGSTSPDRGLILRASLFNQPKDSARLLKNLRWSGTSWTTEDIGFVRQRETVFNAGAAFKEFGIHNLSTGSPRFIQQVGTEVQEYDPTLDPLDTETAIFTAASETTPCMRSFSPNYFLYANGVDLPQKWNGTTWAVLENWPVTEPGGTILSLPKICEVFQYRGVYAGFANDPYGVLISNFGAPSTFTFGGVAATNGGYYQVPSQLGPVTAIRSFRTNMQDNEEVLLIGCQHGLVILTGNGALDYKFVPITTRFGILSQRSWMQLDDAVLVHCTDGIRQLQSNVYFSTLVKSALTYPIHPFMTNLNQSQTQQAFVVENPRTLEAHWYFNSGSDVHNRSCVYMNYADLQPDGSGTRFATREFPPESGGAETYQSPSCGITYSDRQWTGGYNGYLREEWVGNKFNTLGIDWKYGSPLFDPPTPAQEASGRGFYIICDGPSQAFTPQAFVWPGQSSDNNIRRVLMRPTLERTSDVEGETALGAWILGTSAFGGSQWQIFPFYPQGAGRGWDVELGGNTQNGDFSFVGIFSTLIGGGTRQ